MKIAVPCNDGINLSAHFGRSKGFIVFETSNSEITHEAYRENTVTGHAQGHHPEHNQKHEHDEEHNHSHAGILGILADCETIIAGGMGQRLYIDLQAARKKVFITREENAKQAVLLFLRNQLDHNPEVCCNH